MNARKVLVLVAALALLMGGTATAREGYVLRFGGVSVNPTGDLRIEEREMVPLGDGTTLSMVGRGTAEADSAFGFCLELERRFNDLFGLGFTIMHSDHDVDVRLTETVRITDDVTNAVLFAMTESLSETASGDMTPLLMGANFHLGTNGRVDLYGGPFVGLVTYGDLELQGERISFKDEFAYGATVGLDVPFGNGKAAFSAAARYMIASAEPDEPDSEALELDPLTVLFGMGYRF